MSAQYVYRDTIHQYREVVFARYAFLERFRPLAVRPNALHVLPDNIPRSKGLLNVSWFLQVITLLSQGAPVFLFVSKVLTVTVLVKLYAQNVHQVPSLQILGLDQVAIASAQE